MKDKPTLTYQLPTQSCWTHTWIKPPFCHPELGHENDTRFYNQQPRSPARGSKELLRWLVTRESYTWNVDIQNEYDVRVNTPIALPQNRPHADLDDWQVWFVGHATVLIQIGPYNFITDPVWCDYASPLHGRGPRRVCPAGFALEQLPTIHGVLLSHNHYDHMDLATLEWLHKKFAMPIYTGLGNGFYLPKEFHVIEMDWWQEIPYHELRIVIHLLSMARGGVYVTKIRHFGAVFRFWRKQDIVFLRVIPVMPATSNKFIRAMVRRVWPYFQSELMNLVN